MGVPGMSEELVDEILVGPGESIRKTGEPSSPDLQEQRATSGWLVTEGIMVELETMRMLDPFLTSRGAVFRIQVVGSLRRRRAVHADSKLSSMRPENLPRVTFVRET